MRVLLLCPVFLCLAAWPAAATELPPPDAPEPAAPQVHTLVITPPEVEKQLLEDKARREEEQNKTLESHYLDLSQDKNGDSETLGLDPATMPGRHYQKKKPKLEDSAEEEDAATAETEAKKSEDTKSSANDSKDKNDQDKKEDEKQTELVPAKKLKPWGGMDELFASQNKKSMAAKALKAFEQEPGKVPPYGLFLISQLYYDKGDLKNATKYYYAAQLRARFDYSRWPGKGAGSDNPYMNLSSLSRTLSPQISPWALQSSSRLAEILRDVRTWDRETPYAYHPSYPLPEDAPDEKEWPTLLEKARKDFFLDSLKIVQAMKTMGQ